MTNQYNSYLIVNLTNCFTQWGNPRGRDEGVGRQRGAGRERSGQRGSSCADRRGTARVDAAQAAQRGSGSVRGQGPDAASIDDFLAAAGVARGTFYNYFKTTSEVLSAVTSELSDAVIARIEDCVRQIDDPVERVWVGCLIYMEVAVCHPAWGRFIARAGAQRGDGAAD